MLKKSILYIFIFSIGFSSCHTTRQDSKKPIVSATILPLKYFIHEIADTLIDVNILIPPGAAPVNYEPSVDQMISLSNSDLFFQVGLFDFEKVWSEKLAEQSKELKLVTLSKGLNVLHSPGHNHDHAHNHNHENDPHIWMSAQNAKHIAKIIEKALSTQYPLHKNVFESNLQKLLLKINTVDSTVQANLKGGVKQFLIYHPALTYFAKEYGLTQTSIEHNGKEPTVKHIQNIVNSSTEQHNIIFIQKQFDRNNAQVIASEINASIIEIDPLSEDWATEMITLSQHLNLNTHGK